MRWSYLTLEVAPLYIPPGPAEEFETAFSKAQGLIAPMPDYLSPELQRSIERENEYLFGALATLKDHEVGFR